MSSRSAIEASGKARNKVMQATCGRLLGDFHAASTDLPVTKHVRKSSLLISTLLASPLQSKASTINAGHGPFSGASVPAIHRARMTAPSPCRLHLPEAWQRRRPRMIGGFSTLLNAVNHTSETGSWSISTSMPFAWLCLARSSLR